jgi:hypothetical protein
MELHYGCTYIVASCDFAFAYKIILSGKNASYVESEKTDFKIPTKTILEGTECSVLIDGVIRRCVVFPQDYNRKLFGIPLISKNGCNVLVRKLEDREVLEMNQVQSSTALFDVLAQMSLMLRDCQSATVAAHSVARSVVAPSDTAEAPSDTAEAPSASAALSAVAPSSATVAKLRRFYEQVPKIANLHSLAYKFEPGDHLLIARSEPAYQKWICKGQCVTTLTFGKYCSVCDFNGSATPLPHQSCRYGENCTRLTECPWMHFLTPDQFFKALTNTGISDDEL